MKIDNPENLPPFIREMIDDALRYRWLVKQKGLCLMSDGTKWTDENGVEFISSHIMSSEGIQYSAKETLDQTIDAARELQSIIERQKCLRKKNE